MTDPSEDRTRRGDEAGGAAAPESGSSGEVSTEELRAQVEEKYDFENFGPEDMAEMSAEEWDAAFDEESWITGEELLDRVEADLRSRVADRDVFARVERFDDVLVAYSDEGYAAVYPDGSVEGRGTVLRDVQPSVALCSMDTYEVPEPPADSSLPAPEDVSESSDALGNTVLQVVGGVQVLAGLVLLGGFVLSLAGVIGAPGRGAGGVNPALVLVAAIGFLAIGVFMFVTVANARLSDKYRAEEYRERLRAVGLEDGERPAFLADIEGVDVDVPAVESAERAGERDASPDDPDGGRDGDSTPAEP